MLHNFTVSYKLLIELMSENQLAPTSNLSNLMSQLRIEIPLAGLEAVRNRQLIYKEINRALAVKDLDRVTQLQKEMREIDAA